MSGLSANLFKEAPDYVFGSIQNISIVEGTYGDQIEVEVLGLGETAPRKVWFPTSSAQNRKSNWQKWLRAFKEIGVAVASEKNLIGQFFQFQLVPIPYNIPDKATGEMRHFEKDFWKPVKTFKDESTCTEAWLEATGGEVAGASPLADEAEASEPGIPADVVAAAKTVYDALGQKDEAFKVTAKTSWQYNPDELLAAVKSA